MKLIINKHFLLFLVVFTTNLCFSQTEIEPFNLRKKIEIKTKQKTSNNTKKTDTTYLTVDPNKLKFIEQFDYLLNKSLTKEYINAVFSRKNSTIQQFVKPIKIYIDPNLKQDLKEEFITFVSDIPKIKNLPISFVKNINESNYYIKIADKDFYGLPKKTLDKYTAEERKNLIFEKIDKINFNDNNKNSFACLLTLSPSIFKDDNMMTKLKKAFFITLGNFNVLYYGAPSESVLDFKTTTIDRLSGDDILLLKMHYFHPYDFKVDIKTFQKFKDLKNKS